MIFIISERRTPRKLISASGHIWLLAGDVFDGSYDEIEDDDHIQGFEKKITSKKLNIEIAKTGLITLPQAIDNLESVTEKDIIATTAGKLYVGNSYMKCWIRGTAKDRWDC